MRLNPTCGEAHREVLDEGHEGRDADVGQAGEADVGIGERIGERRCHDGAELRSGASRHFLRNEHVGGERRVRTVLLGGTDRNDHGVLRLQERFDLEGGHLSQKYRWRLHGSGSSGEVRKGLLPRCQRTDCPRSPPAVARTFGPRRDGLVGARVPANGGRAPGTALRSRGDGRACGNLLAMPGTRPWHQCCSAVPVHAQIE